MPEEFLWTHKDVDLASHPVLGLVLQVGDAEALDFESLDLFLRASKQGSYFIAIDEDGGGKRLVQVELAFEADYFAASDPV